jgi:[protein-PII] uridylyltransferase
MPTETHVHQDMDRNWTVLEVATPDRPGLLARIGEIFIDFNIALQAAKIQTLGERVEDVFFIVDNQGGQVTEEARLAGLQAAIRGALDEGVRQSA